MAGGDSKEGGKQVVSALHSIPFGNIIGGPLAACVHAQAEASQTTLNFIRGFTMADSGIDVDGAEPVTVTFSFVMNGVPTLMTLPLMTLVPIPYMRIEHVNLSFTADITACSNEKMEARYASEGYKRTEESEKSVSVQSKMGIHVRATTSDMPSGMARMLDFFANNLIIQETLTAQEVSDMRLEAARQRAIRRNDEAEKARIEAQQAQEKARREAQEKARREEQEKRQLHRQIALLIRDLKYKKETEEASAPQDQSAGSTSSATPGRVYPNGKGSFMGDSSGSSSTGSSTSSGTSGRVYPNRRGTILDTPNDSSSSSTPTRAYPSGKGAFMDSSSTSSTSSGSSSTTGSSSSSSTPNRAYPKGKGAYLGASARSYLAGMGAAAASKAGSDDKDAKPAESQQSESQPTRAQLLRGQMPSLGKKAINIRSLRKKK